jgi:filamentous hemagglutinin family protein
MKLRQKAYLCQGIAIATSTLLFPYPAGAQIIPDATLPVNSNVAPNGNTLTIEGGTRANGNLFHSFKEFSLPAGSEAFFNNAIDVQNIFTRVTGGNISNIDGLIRANGGANLFLLNPAGIVFGPNAKLNIGGSFFGTTAASIRFADGVEFSATNPSASPLLTVSVPIGLQFGSNPAPIQVNGTGHNITRTSFLAPLVRNAPNSGLKVNPNNTIALIGGNINLNGGVLTAEGGNIELGAVSGESASVGITATNSGWAIAYDSVQQFADIQLTQRSLVDAGNTAPGSIRIRASNLSLQEASALFLENRSTQPTGTIDIQTTQSVQLVGDSPSNTLFSSGILSDARNSGRGGDVSISTQRLLVQGSSNLIRAWTFGAADGGNIRINAPDISIIGGLQDTSVVVIRTFGNGNGGNLTIDTARLFLENGGSIGNNVNGGSGSAGNLTVNATESVEIGGSGGLTNSLMGSSAVSRSGSSGKVTVNTARLVVSDGAVISSSTYGSGTAGSITVNAAESIEIRGTGFNASTRQIQPSAIQSAGILTPAITQQQFRLGDTVTGPAGNVTLNTPRLQITEGGTATVRHNHLGNAGTLNVNADEVLLDGGGSLTASTQSGKEGNINLQVRHNLQLRNGSQIDAESFGTGNGGNITIDSPTIIGLENSDIIANAVQGNGGNIQIRTQAIFGIQYRPQQTPESDITASSQFGLSGTVAITNPEVETRSLLVELPQNLVDTEGQITSGCDPTQGNTFTVAGRGGLPEDPTSGLLGRAIWWDDRDLSDSNVSAVVPPEKVPKSEPTPEIVEATGWIINQQGQVELVANHNNNNSWRSPTNCQTLR